MMEIPVDMLEFEEIEDKKETMIEQALQEHRCMRCGSDVTDGLKSVLTYPRVISLNCGRCDKDFPFTPFDLVYLCCSCHRELLSWMNIPEYDPTQ